MEVWNNFKEWFTEHFDLNELLSEEYDALRNKVCCIEKVAYQQWRKEINSFLNKVDNSSVTVSEIYSSRGFKTRFVPKKFGDEHLLKTTDLTIKTVKEKPIVAKEYNHSHDGKAVSYTTWFALFRATLQGKRRLFANFLAWLKGEGTLFPNTKNKLRKKQAQDLVTEPKCQLLYTGFVSCIDSGQTISAEALSKYLRHENIDEIETKAINHPAYQAMFGYQARYFQGADSVSEGRTLVELARHQFIKAGVRSQACMDRATALLIDLADGKVKGVEYLAAAKWSKVDISLDSHENTVRLSVNAGLDASDTGMKKTLKLDFALTDTDEGEIKLVSGQQPHRPSAFVNEGMSVDPDSDSSSLLGTSSVANVKIGSTCRKAHVFHGSGGLQQRDLESSIAVEAS